jgi:hypothetical protein
LFSQFEALHSGRVDDYNRIAAEVNRLLGRPPGPVEMR